MRIRNAVSSDLEAIYRLEMDSFSEAVQDSFDTIRDRFLEYPEGMFVVENNGKVVGSIITACLDELDLVSSNDLKNMKIHHADGKLLVILSLMVSRTCHGKGYGTLLIKHIIKYAMHNRKFAIVLMCRENLIPYYRKLNFKLLKKSSSVKGGKTWYEMILKLNREIAIASKKAHKEPKLYPAWEFPIPHIP